MANPGTILPNYSMVRKPSTSDGTLGEIFNPDSTHLCYTIELPWLDNRQDQSCIPATTYTCATHNSQEHPNTWEIANVPQRTGVLIHNGNTEKGSLGCIVVGSTTGVLNGLPAVSNSNVTLAMLQKTLPGNFALAISWATAPGVCWLLAAALTSNLPG
jgi:hypothetical protein